MANLRHLIRGLGSVSSFRPAQNVKKSVFKSLILNSTRNYSDKSVAFIINKNMNYNLSISYVGCEGFTLANGDEVVGPTIIFPHSLLSWNVVTVDDVNEDSLVLFKLLEPKIDLLIFGYGTKQDFSIEQRQKFAKICKNLGLRFEALPTEQAVGLFNFLSSDRQFVAAALIPPSEVDIQKVDKKLYLGDGDEDEEEEEEEELPLISDNKTVKRYLK